MNRTIVRRGGVVAVLVLVGVIVGHGQRGPLTTTKVPTTIATGALKDKTGYTLVKPENWNGTVFFALDCGQSGL